MLLLDRRQVVRVLVLVGYDVYLSRDREMGTNEVI